MQMQMEKQRTGFKVGDQVMVAFPCTVVAVERKKSFWWDNGPDAETIVVQTGGEEEFTIQEEACDEANCSTCVSMAAAQAGKHMRIVSLTESGAPDEVVSSLFAVSVAVAKV